MFGVFFFFFNMDLFCWVQFSSVTQSCLILWSHGLQHARLPYPPPTPGAWSNPCPLSWWCHPTISSSVIPFSSCLQYLPASGSFPMSQLFASGDTSIRVSVSASVLPMNIQGWFALGLYPLLKKLTTPVPWCLLAFHEVPHSVREVYFSLNKSTSYLPFFFLTYHFVSHWILSAMRH